MLAQVPSRKPFVIVRISQANLAFLEGVAAAESTYVGCIAAELIEHAVSRFERQLALGARRLKVMSAASYGERPTRVRWLLTPELHRRLHALPWQGSVSRLVDAVITDARTAAARNRRRRARAEHSTQGHAWPRPKAPIEPAWPWRAHGLSLAEAKAAWRRFVLDHHPDRGGDNDLFVRGKDDWESAQLP